MSTLNNNIVSSSSLSSSSSSSNSLELPAISQSSNTSKNNNNNKDNDIDQNEPEADSIDLTNKFSSVNTDFSIPMYSKNVHYGPPAILSKYYHQPGSYFGQETGYSSEDTSDNEEKRLKKKKRRRRRRRRQKHLKKQKKKKKKQGKEETIISTMKKTEKKTQSTTEVVPIERQEVLEKYFSPRQEEESSQQYATTTTISNKNNNKSNKNQNNFSVTLSPIRRVAIRDKIRKSKLQLVPSANALTNFASNDNSNYPLGIKRKKRKKKANMAKIKDSEEVFKSTILKYEIGTKMSVKLSTKKYRREAAAIAIQRIYRKYRFLCRTYAAIAIENRIREHNWCKEVIRKNLKKMENRFMYRIFSTWQVHSSKRASAKKMAIRHLHGFKAKCYDAWKQWTKDEIEERLKKQALVIKKIVHGKVLRALRAWNIYTQNNKKVTSFRKVWNQRILRQRIGEWQDAAHISYAANCIRRFWKAMLINILMHKSWLIRTNAAIQIEKICRGYLAKKRVAVLRINSYATRIQKWFRGIVGRSLADEEFEAENLREQIRYLHEQHLVNQFMLEAKEVTKHYPTHVMITKFSKYLWKQNRRIEYDADRALKTLHILVDSDSDEESDVEESEEEEEEENGREEKETDEALIKKSKKRPKDHKEVTLDQVTNHAFAIFDLFDVDRTGEISETNLVSLLTEMGLKDPEYEASTVDRVLSEEEELKAKNAKRIEALNNRMQQRRHSYYNNDVTGNSSKTNLKQGATSKIKAGNIEQKSDSTILSKKKKKVKKNKKNKDKGKKNTRKPKISLVGFLNYYMGSFDRWQRENSRIIPKIRHGFYYHRYGSSKRSLILAIDAALENAAIKIFRDSKPPKFYDDISGLPFATLQQLNDFKKSKEHLKKNGIRGPWNKLPKDSKSGIALKWLLLENGGEKYFQHQIIKQIMKREKAFNLHGKLHTHVISYRNLEEGEIILEYYPRGRQGKKFEIKLPPMYESVDMNRESFFLESDILDPNISRDGHVRFTHGLHNTIQVRSIGTNGVVIARSNHHGGLNTKEEVGYGTTVSVNVDDHIWLYKEYDSLRKNHSKYKHEFIVNRVERENTKAGKRRKLRQKGTRSSRRRLVSALSFRGLGNSV